MNVYRIALVLYNENELGKTLATKSARVHETDIPAGNFLFSSKCDEIWNDMLHTMKAKA